MNNKEQILKTLLKYKVLEKKARKIVVKHFFITTGELPIAFEVDAIRINEDTIEMIYTTACNDSVDTNYYQCPVKYLWDKKWEEKLI